MSFAFEGFATPQPVTVEIVTDAARVSGTITTPFRRVAEILNQLPAGHLAVEHATIVEHGGGTPTKVPSALVALEAIVVMQAVSLVGEARDDMRIQKRPIRARLLVPPLTLTGMVHVALGSRPADGFLNSHERFMPMTDVTISSAAYPSISATASILAFRRDRAQVVVLADEEHPDDLLDEVLDEATARSWLAGGGGTGNDDSGERAPARDGQG